MKKFSNYIALSPSETRHPSYNASIFRKAQTEKTWQLGTAHTIGAEKMERGETMSSRFLLNHLTMDQGPNITQERACVATGKGIALPNDSQPQLNT
ncbi:hypothetical protein PIB30_058640 [Stylosanthes scabra]|uniref:Uncharacterized protein n=1 Tax=Stylosanthes scabra TaxID=79078 RepID=A0ABU6TJT6_9FABA|nr:hypothetical protein [Stylosanthes scabra]